LSELEEAIKTIEDLRRQDPCLQRGRNRELIGSFKVFWDSGPDEDTFTKQTDGLLFTNRMIYYMNEHPIWRMKDKSPVSSSKEVPAIVAQPGGIEPGTGPVNPVGKHGGKRR
jgi:hypothetical protein